MYLKVEIIIPEENVNELVVVLNNEGLIGEGHYDYVYNYFPVKGHFRPLKGASPYSGQKGKISHVEEVQLNIRIPFEERNRTEELIRHYHPYEVPVINFIKLV